MNRAGNDLEKTLWDAANQLWVNTKLKPLQRFPETAGCARQKRAAPGRASGAG